MGSPGHTESIENSDFHRKSYSGGIFHSMTFTAFEIRETCAKFCLLTELCLKLKPFLEGTACYLVDGISGVPRNFVRGGGGQQI